MKGGAAYRGAAYRGAANRGAAYRGAANRAATRRGAAILLLALACALSACRTAPPKESAAAPAEPASPPPVQTPPPVVSENETPPPTAEAVKPEPVEPPPCTCVENTPKSTPKRKPKPVVHTPPPAPPVETPAPPAPGEVGVKRLESASASILGEKVRAQNGEDLGRVVDILADREGRVRAAVIEFGGFLGVGNRRIAVDWSLLKFQPGNADAPVTVEGSKERLQATPEYKGAERPLALMAPAAAASPPAAPK